MNSKNKFRVVTLASVITMSAIVTIPVSTAAQAQTPPSQNCALHIWPTKNLSAGNIGSSMNGLLPALIAGSSAKQTELASAVLDGPGQLDRLISADPVKLLKLPNGTKIVTHDAPNLQSQVNEKAPALESGCRYELRVVSIIYGRHPLYGKDIVSRFAFREISADGKSIRSYNKQARVKMHNFPNNSIPENDQERNIMADMMNGAFVDGFIKFVSSIKEFR
jgi:hypothetical protein